MIKKLTTLEPHSELLPGERKYIGENITYIVSARFEKPESKNTLRSRLERVITGEMTDLIHESSDGKMAAEYVCSGCMASQDARKED